jgi:hypothetical protein
MLMHGKQRRKRDGIKWTGGTRPLLGELEKEAVKPVMHALPLDDEGDKESKTTTGRTGLCTKDPFAAKSPPLSHVGL